MPVKWIPIVFKQQAAERTDQTNTGTRPFMRRAVSLGMSKRMKWDRSSREAMGQPTDHAAALAPRDVVATWMVR